jgi:hypothetical protein
MWGGAGQTVDLWEYLCMTDTTPQTIAELQEMVVRFRDARDWKQFHNAKDMALSLVLEAAEVLEHFQWKTEGELAAHVGWATR